MLQNIFLRSQKSSLSERVEHFLFLILHVADVADDSGL